MGRTLRLFNRIWSLKLSGELRNFRNKTILHECKLTDKLVYRSYIETKKEKEVGCPVKVTSRVDKERERKEVLDSDYWNQMANILPPMHECLWNSLQDGLTSYSLELDKRERLIEETDSLQLQNTELKMLLQQYLDAQVNQELLQPPVQMLAFN